MPNYQGVWSLSEQFQAKGAGNWFVPSFALFGGSGDSTTIDVFSLTTQGNATDFGTMTTQRRLYGASGSSTRALFGGGRQGSTDYQLIDYVTYASGGSTATFGNLSYPGKFTIASASNGTRSLFGGGYNVAQGGGVYNTIDYVTIASTGNSLDFGNLTDQRYYPGALASSVRAVFAGGSSSAGGRSNVIAYVTIASTGNATDFGDLLETTYGLAGCSSSTRGLFSGGQASSGASNVIQYITIASTGNATDFGDLTVTDGGPAATSSQTIALIGGFTTSNTAVDFVTIASTGNGADYGDLSVGRGNCAATSNAHGGLS
jgi:hypothetical protein